MILLNIASSSIGLSSTSGNFNKNVIFGNDISLAYGGSLAKGPAPVPAPAPAPAPAPVPAPAPAPLSVVKGVALRPYKLYTDHSRRATATASSYYSSAFSPSLAIDDDTTTSWSSKQQGCEAEITLTLDSPTEVTSIGARSRDMVNDIRGPLTGDSVIKSFSVSADGEPLIVCDIPGNYKPIYNKDGSIVSPLAGLSSPWGRIHYCDIPSVTASVFKLKAHECILGSVNNTGFVEIELLSKRDPPSDRELTISDLDSCLETNEDLQLAYGKELLDFDIETALGKKGSFWDVDVYIRGKASFIDTLSGSWLCAIAHATVQYFNPQQFQTLTSSTLGVAEETLFFEESKVDGLSFPVGGSVSETFMTKLHTYCEKVLQLDDSDKKNVLQYVCESLYGNAILYRIEAFLAPLPGTEGLDLPEGRGISKHWLETYFGNGPLCTGSPSCQFKVGPMTLTRPLGTYLYSERMPQVQAIDNPIMNAFKIGNNIFGGIYVPFYDGHFRAAMDGGSGSSIDTSIPVQWLGDGYYPAHYEICATSRGFFDKLKSMKSKETGKALLCSGVVQRLVESVSMLLGLEKKLRFISTVVIGEDTGNVTVVQGDVQMCNSSNTEKYLGPEFIAASTKGSLYTTMKPIPNSNNPFGLDTDVAFGTWGPTHLSGKTFLALYSSWMQIQALHLPPMNTFCKEKDLPLMFSPFPPYIVDLPGLYTWDISMNFNRSWTRADMDTVVEDPSFLNTCYNRSSQARAPYTPDNLGGFCGFLPAYYMYVDEQPIGIRAHAAELLALEPVYVM
jgi:hypothetical protein